MKYFVLKQDRNLENAIEIEGFNNSQKMTLLKADEDKYKDSTNVPVHGNENSIYPDLIQAPVLIISDELHKLFKLYEHTIVYKIAVFSDLKRKKQKVYRLVLPELLDALSDKSVFFKNGWIDKIVLDDEKIGDYNIFQIKAGVDYYFIVSLDVVESMLKRGLFVGIKFEEVEVI
ncbi:hypothetical protein [Clostridium saccharobutylicum]|uniref:Uncharacterized protein n=1 Tax=Clostridium saccharobutylicum TaxID=169679 RepID=A0A1S8N5Q7_CLOSA|nr:hypothetical protein [Clostridium saccharobutylicum]OOM11723.1 hypothetical protein CLOSAC_21500 [Clostridium saccharobutylicum]